MSFASRLGQTNAVIAALKTGLWESPLLSRRLAHVNYGAEHLIPQPIHQLVRFAHTETTRHIRFAPDFFVVDRKDPQRTYLLEYKCTQTPLFSRRRIQTIRGQSPRKDIDWQDIGQMEAEAYDNYRALAGLGVRLALMDYCAYHGRLLVCDFVERITPLHRDRVRATATAGSRTPFINFDLTPMRSLEEFIAAEHSFELHQVAPLCAKIKQVLQKRLPVKHHRQSPLYRR
jgi:hypothetical protein